MPQRAISQDGKRHITTVPVRLRKMQGIELSPKHEGKQVLLNRRFAFQ